MSRLKTLKTPLFNIHNTMDETVNTILDMQIEFLQSMIDRDVTIEETLEQFIKAKTTLG